MEKELHILILEDLPSDAELAQKELKRVLKNYTVKVVDTEKGFVQALETFKPDLIISDYQLPAFDGLSALQIIRKKSPFIPFVVLTGSMNEDTAVECIKAGADDYVIKEHIKRLGPAVLNAMENKKIELERKQAEEKLQDSEEHLKILFDYAPDAYYINDIKGKFIDGNKAAERLIGYKKEELIGKSFLKLKLLSLSDIPKAAKLLVKNLRGQPTGSDEFVLNRKDNSKVTVEISTYPVKIKGRTLALGIARDITERKQAEEEIKNSAAKWQTTFDAMNDAVSLMDNNGIVLQCNKSYLNLLGKTETEILGKHCWEIVHGTNKPIDGCPIVKMKKSLQRESMLLPVDDKWFNIVVDPIFDASNNLIKAVHIITDITERKQAESKLQIERDKLTAIFESMADGVYIVNKDYDIQYVNPVLKKTFGSPEGKKCHKYFHDSDEPCTFCKNEEVFAGKTVHWEWTSPKYGKTYDLIDTPMKNADGSISKLEIFRDITERKRAGERLKKTMNATIETMSKIIEIKDPYTAGHQQRVSQLATAIAKELNLSPDKIEGIRVASLIHDIGKIGVPTEILSKTTTLSDIEFSLIKEHSQIGYNILKSIDFSYPVARIVLQHHEKINGSGYPRGLKGDEILLEAKIMGVADVVEAMSSHRPYRPALGVDAALEEISKNKGILYDPEVVDICIKLVREKGFKF